MLDSQEDLPVVGWWRNQRSVRFGARAAHWSPPASSALRCWRCSTSKHWGLQTGWASSPPMTMGEKHTHVNTHSLAMTRCAYLRHTSANKGQVGQIGNTRWPCAVQQSEATWFMIKRGFIAAALSTLDFHHEKFKPMWSTWCRQGRQKFQLLLLFSFKRTK